MSVLDAPWADCPIHACSCLCLHVLREQHVDAGLRAPCALESPFWAASAEGMTETSSHGVRSIRQAAQELT